MFNNKQELQLVEDNSRCEKVEAHTNRLGAFQSFPDALFLFRNDLFLHETNVQGKLALEKHWLGLTDQRLHFHSRDNNKIVKKIIERLYSGLDEAINHHKHCERFVLLNIDSVWRSYTISRATDSDEDLLLVIHGDVSYNEGNIRSLQRAFGLTSREANIINMMVLGMKPKQIAFELDIALNTVRSHLRTLYVKMQVRDFNEALTLAIRLLV